MRKGGAFKPRPCPLRFESVEQRHNLRVNVQHLRALVAGVGFGVARLKLDQVMLDRVIVRDKRGDSAALIDDD